MVYNKPLQSSNYTCTILVLFSPFLKKSFIFKFGPLSNNREECYRSTTGLVHAHLPFTYCLLPCTHSLCQLTLRQTQAPPQGPNTVAIPLPSFLLVPATHSL